PYWYLRVQDSASGRYAIFGGADHKTGQERDTEARYARVSETLCRLIPSAKIERRWTGQVIETADGLPYIGEVAPHQYIATGFAGNGLTFGTLAAIMIRDALLGTENPWRDLFDPRRKASSIDALATVVAENLDYPRYLIHDVVAGQDRSGVEHIPRGSGKVIALDGRRVAAHRTDDGTVIKVSAVCTHLGCLVRWNDAERTWDCPCHGSRFTPEGLVLGGPAEAPLERID
ncbi:MAG TPA: FAD-dependent oxidoreductase, partial [Gemmatimonadaceae bacterium]|nr:FAD-dependent oxidoreductase [Gemmatimonadaceae bacterium]